MKCFIRLSPAYATSFDKTSLIPKLIGAMSRSIWPLLHNIFFWDYEWSNVVFNNRKKFNFDHIDLAAEKTWLKTLDLFRFHDTKLWIALTNAAKNYHFDAWGHYGTSSKMMPPTMLQKKRKEQIVPRRAKYFCDGVACLHLGCEWHRQCLGTIFLLCLQISEDLRRCWTPEEGDRTRMVLIRC